MRGSQPDEGADQATEEAVDAQIARHGDKAKAGLLAADNRLMIQRLVAEVEIAGAEPASLVAEAAPQDAGQLSPGMGMFEHMRAGGRPEQERARFRWARQFYRPHADAGGHAPAAPDAIVP